MMWRFHQISRGFPSKFIPKTQNCLAVSLQTCRFSTTPSPEELAAADQRMASNMNLDRVGFSDLGDMLKTRDNVLSDFGASEDQAKRFSTERVGRAWTAAELRLKSFDDLHKLYFVLLKERNKIMTFRGLSKTSPSIAPKTWRFRLKKVNQSIARLKTVVGERQAAYQEKLKEARDLIHHYEKKQLYGDDTQESPSPL